MHELGCWAQRSTDVFLLESLPVLTWPRQVFASALAPLAKAPTRWRGLPMPPTIPSCANPCWPRPCCVPSGWCGRTVGPRHGRQSPARSARKCTATAPGRAPAIWPGGPATGSLRARGPACLRIEVKRLRYLVDQWRGVWPRRAAALPGLRRFTGPARHSQRRCGGGRLLARLRALARCRRPGEPMRKLLLVRDLPPLKDRLAVLLAATPVPWSGQTPRVNPARHCRVYAAYQNHDWLRRRLRQYSAAVRTTKPKETCMHSRTAIRALTLSLVTAFSAAQAGTVSVVTTFPKEVDRAYKKAFGRFRPGIQIEILNKNHGEHRLHQGCPGPAADVMWASAPAYPRSAGTRRSCCRPPPRSRTPRAPARSAAARSAARKRTCTTARPWPGYGLMWNTRYMQANKVPAPKVGGSQSSPILCPCVRFIHRRARAPHT